MVNNRTSQIWRHRAQLIDNKSQIDVTRSEDEQSNNVVYTTDRLIPNKNSTEGISQILLSL